MAWLIRGETITGVFELHDGPPDGYNWLRIAQIAGSVLSRPVRTVLVPAGVLFTLARLNLILARIRGSGAPRRSRHSVAPEQGGRVLIRAQGAMVHIEDVLARIFAHLQPLAPPDLVLEEDTDLVGTLGLDSVTVIDMVLELEDEYDISVPLNALVDVRTPRQLARLVHGLWEGS